VVAFIFVDTGPQARGSMNGWRRPVHESAYDKAPLEELEEEGELIRELMTAAELETSRTVR
jgi:hypothetical protein